MTPRTSGWLALAALMMVNGCDQEKRQQELARGEKKAAKENRSSAAQAAKAWRIAD